MLRFYKKKFLNFVKKNIAEGMKVIQIIAISMEKPYFLHSFFFLRSKIAEISFVLSDMRPFSCFNIVEPFVFCCKKNFYCCTAFVKNLEKISILSVVNCFACLRLSYVFCLFILVVSLLFFIAMLDSSLLLWRTNFYFSLVWYFVFMF